MPYPQELVAPVYPKGTAPVGTPVKVFAPYAAPNFTSPGVAVGQIVTSVTIQSTASTDQASVPFTFGHAFKRGDLAPGCNLAGLIAGQPDLPLQVNVKATHDDGSVRHAIISGILPALAANASVKMGLKSVVAPVFGATVGIPATLPSAVVTIAGVVYTAKPSGTPMTWFAGPVASDYVYNVAFVDAAGNPHPFLSAQLSVRAYANGQVKTDIAVEHCKAYQAAADITYDVTLSCGAQTYSQTALVHAPYARWKKTLWSGAAPSLHIAHDSAYLITSRAVPNYDQSVKPDEATLQSYATSLASGKFGPMKFGRFNPEMGTTGGRPDIGILPDSYAMTVLSMDKRAKDMMLASADCGGTWRTHFRDTSSGPGAGAPMSIINFPYSSIAGNINDCNNPLTGKNEYLKIPSSSIGGQADSSHQPNFAYLPYLLTGDYYYLEELHFWISYNLVTYNPAYRNREQGLLYSDQGRGQGWSLRTLAEAAAFTPDNHPSKQSYIYWVESNMTWYNARYTDGSDNALGMLTTGVGGYPINGVQNVGMAPWMDDFFTQSLGHAVELLGYDSLKRLLTWKAKFSIGRMTAPGFNPMLASIYALGVRPDQNSPYFTTLADCLNFTLPTLKDIPWGTQQYVDALQVAMGGDKLKLHDMIGYPYGTEGYPSNLQPALAMAVDSGADNGAQAWATFMARDTKPNYGTEPQFAIVPRAAVQAVPVTPPVTAPTTTPATVPTSTPAPTPAPVIKETVSYQQATMDDVMSAYAKSLVPAGASLSKSDWFYDSVKGVVVLKLTTAAPAA